ncbi:speedy protein 1-B-like isoform X1 [Dendropsophus ebraccatus]|uniref:speedy protein 1-B-like isoform X1 n=1 Tax=Dendropsophus ebraccatus TaxID=150705 RepID=UPI003831D974
MRKRKKELMALYEEESSASTSQEEPKKKKKKTEDDIPQPEERAAFFRLLDDDYIQFFLARDSCFIISDKYLLAMVLTYFRRAHLRTEEYSTFFFPALFLANQFEEDMFYRQKIYPWAFGWNWTAMKDFFHHLRNQLLLRMGFRAWVARTTCDLTMAQDPEHWAWQRERKDHHSWAIRWYKRDDDDYILRGPWTIPLPCSLCNTIRRPCQGEETIQCQADTKEEPGTADS